MFWVGFWATSQQIRQVDLAFVLTCQKMTPSNLMLADWLSPQCSVSGHLQSLLPLSVASKADPGYLAHWDVYFILWDEVLPISLNKKKKKATEIKGNCFNCVL